MTPLAALLRAAAAMGHVVLYSPALETPRKHRLVSAPDPRQVSK